MTSRGAEESPATLQGIIRHETIIPKKPARPDRHRLCEAIALACRDRLRPILMTALITVIVMLPVALAPKTGMDAYQPLGTVIVAGLTVGTLLSLLVIPVMHALVDDLGQWAASRRRRPAEAEPVSSAVGAASMES